MAAVTGLLRSGTDGEKGQNHKGKTCDGNSGLSLMTGRLPPTSLTIFPPLNLNLSPYRLQPPTSNISQHASTFFLCLQPQTSTPPPSNALPPQPFPKPPPTSNLNPPTSPRSSTARIERYNCPFQACSLSLEGWVLNDLPLRASS